MLLFGHVGLTLGGVYALKAIRENIDFRAIAVLSVLPDLIDKPLGLTFRKTFENNTRLFAHSLLFSLSILLLLLILRKKNKLNYPWLFWIVMDGHLLLDRIWQHDLPAFLWPFLGPLPPKDPEIFKQWLHVLTVPFYYVSETIGLIIVISVFLTHRLWKTQNLKQFLLTGRLKSDQFAIGNSSL